MDIQNVLNTPINATAGLSTTYGSAVHHILSGSFRSVSLFLLVFSPVTRELSHLQTIPAFGPHQYLAANSQKDRVYTTSWALPPTLSSWEVERSHPEVKWKVKHLNTVPITATSSYIAIPPPYTYVYSAGGPTGEVHTLDPETGAFSEKVQQVLFVPKPELEAADKTRVALRYGSHGIEFTPSRQYAFIPVLGTQSIKMYSRDLTNGLLTHITSVGSPRGRDANDGPRHVKIHPNGKILYCVTEHSNYVDAYRIYATTLEHVASRSLLPDQFGGVREPETQSKSHFRGDTLMLPPPTSSNPSPRVLFTTTRGSASDLRGWLSAFPLDEDGIFTTLPPTEGQTPSQNDDEYAERFQTPTSGGKANALDILPKSDSLSSNDQYGLWILLTDDDDVTASSSGTGAVRVLEWDGWGKGGVRVVSEWPSAGTSPAVEAEGAETAEGKERIMGASHAIWLD